MGQGVGIWLLLHIREPEHLEGQALLFDVLEEVLGDHGLVMVLLIVKLGVAVLARDHVGAVLLLF